MKIAYIMKRYPRYSETFIVNEILAHEQAGEQIHIFALLPPEDSHFQDIISRVKAPVSYLSAKADRASSFWDTQKKVAKRYPKMWSQLGRFPKASAREALQAMELALQIDIQGIQHLHAHFASTSTTVAQIAAAITDISFTFTAHAKDIFHQDTDFELLASKFRDAQAAVTVSDFNLDYLIDELQVSKDKVHRIYNGLDLNEFCYSSPEDREPIICAVGRLVEKKGFSYLIEACRILKSRGVSFQCEIIGSGDLSYQLAHQIEQAGLNDCVSLLGSLPQKEVKQHLERACLFAAPCLVGQDGNRDGLPTVLLEAMAMGTPCISTDVTGIPEVIEHNRTGLMVDQHDAEALSLAIEQLKNNKELRVQLAKHARQLIEDKFDVHTNAKQMRRCLGFPAQPIHGFKG